MQTLAYYLRNIFGDIKFGKFMVIHLICQCFPLYGKPEMVKGSKIFDLVKILLWRYPQDMANKFCSTATLLFDSNNLEVLDVACHLPP